MELPIAISRAEFVKGMQDFYPEEEDPGLYVACVGRSNAGKSTLINRITNKKKLARTSAQPGRTQQINIFDCVITNKQKPIPFFLTDLPGFGYAKASKAKKGELSILLRSYLSETDQMRICLLIQDIRRDPEDEELAIRELLFERNILVVPVLTKVDKLRSGEKKARAKIVAQQYGVETGDVVLAGDGESILPLLQIIYAGLSVCEVEDSSLTQES